MKLKKLVKLVSICSLFISAVPVNAEDEMTENNGIHILFTSNLNAMIDGHAENIDGEIVQMGGFSNLSSTIAQYRTENSILLDAGNYATGSMYAYSNSEFTIMTELGYDVITLGQHEFLQSEESLLSHLESQESPVIVQGNLMNNDVNAYIDQYTIQEVDGYQVGIFGLLSDQTMIDVSEYTFMDALNRADEIVAELQAEGVDYIICLSTGGLNEEESVSYDQILATKVDGIDLIISGNNEEMLEEPLVENDTLIVSGGENGDYLGSITVDPEQNTVISYENIKVEAQETAGYFDAGKYYNQVTQYFIDEGYSPRNKIATADESLLGNTQTFIADTIAASFEETSSSSNSYAIGILPAQYAGPEIRAGNVTNAAMINAYGAGTEDSADLTLVTAYISGADLRKLCEIDYTLGSIYPMFEMTFGGLYYTYLDQRMTYNKIVDVYVQLAQGYWGKITDDTYYPIVTTRKFQEILTQASALTDGILDIKLTNEDGTEDLTDTFTENYLISYTGTQMTMLTALTSEIQLSYQKGSDNVRVISSYSTLSNQKTETDLTVVNYFIHSSPYALDFYLKIGAGIVIAIVALSIFFQIMDKIHPGTQTFED